MATCNDVRTKARMQGLATDTELDASNRMVFRFYATEGQILVSVQTGARQALRWLKERKALEVNPKTRARIQYDA